MLLLAVTEFTCSVQPFHDGYDRLENVPIVTACTAYDDAETGETIILIFHQVLWFGDAMPQSLISSQQIRSFGISMCDDPYDPHRPIGIDDQVSGIKIPFNTENSMVGITTRRPSLEEVHDCRNLVMTNELPWNPRSESLPHHSSISAITRANTVEEDLEESDLLLGTCSTALTPASFEARCIATVNVSRESSSAHSRTMAAIQSKGRYPTLTAEDLARKFQIGLETAKDTLKATTLLGVRSAIHPLLRRYKADLVRGIEARRLPGKWYCDMLFSKHKSLRGNTCAMAFTNKSFVSIYPKQSKRLAGECLDEFADDVGVPANLSFDKASEQVGENTAFMKSIRELKIFWRVIEPYVHKNPADNEIRELKKRWKRTRQRTNCSPRLWDYGLMYESRILQRIARQPSGRTGYENALGETPDISEDITQEFYDPVWYITDPSEIDSPFLGRWLGPSRRIGGHLCSHILSIHGKVVSTSSFKNISEEEMRSPVVLERIRLFETQVARILNDDTHEIDPSEENGFFLSDTEDDTVDIEAADGEPTAEEVDPLDLEPTPDAFDTYIGAQLLVPRDGERVNARVTKRMRNNNGVPIGTRHDNPMLDSREYEVEFDDGSTQEYFANVIAENLYSQIDEEGRQYLVLKGIVDHKADESAITKEDGTFRTNSGNLRMKKTTRGWKLLVEWMDGTTDWMPLKDLKEANPIEIAEYAVSNRIDDEPAFKWWVPYVIRKRNRIISKVKSKYWRTSHKFGIRVPKTVAEAYEIDRKTGTLHWTRAIEKEMSKIQGMNSFEKVDGLTPEALRQNATKLPGHGEVRVHMIFDIKMDGNFTRKARLVCNGHETPDIPQYDKTSTVVSRESVRIAFLYASLNDLDILSCDVTNAYLNAPCKEKLWLEAGPEFGSLRGSVMVVKKAVYGLRSAGNSWHITLSQTIREMGFEPSRSDPDLWMRANTKPNGEKYWEYVLCYVDDILAISHEPGAIMKDIAKKYDLKEEAKPPERYLGANIGKWELPDQRSVWAMSSKDYMTNAVKLVKDILEKRGLALPTGGSTKRPMHQDYRPEIDVSPELGRQDLALYQQLVGMLRWGAELGRLDYLYELSVLSSHLALPREGHLEAIFGIFGYIAKHLDSTLVFDDFVPQLHMPSFPNTDWSTSVYGDIEEERPRRMKTPLGKSVQIVCFVDASHAGDKSTRRSHTGFIIYLNNAPIDWYSKRQNTVETSTFSSELVAMRTAVERIKALRIKLMDFGIPIDGPAYVLGDNESVVKSTSNKEANLNKKHQAICWHAVREASAAGWVRIGWEPTQTNTADLFTKSLSPIKRRTLLQQIFIKC